MFNLVILRFKIFRFVLYLWSQRYYKYLIEVPVVLENRLTKSSFIII